MSRSTFAITAVVLALVGLSPETARGQSLATRPASDAAPAEARGGDATPAFPAGGSPLALARRPLDFRADDRPDAGRGIEDATTGVWVGGAVGAVVGGLTASWAYCSLGEGDCGFSVTAAGPGVLIGAILGASIGGLLDDGGSAESEG